MAELKSLWPREALVLWFRHPKFGYGVGSREQQDLWPEADAQVTLVAKDGTRHRVRFLQVVRRGPRQPCGAVVVL